MYYNNEIYKDLVMKEFEYSFGLTRYGNKEGRFMTPMEYFIYFYLKKYIKIPEEILEALDIQNLAKKNQLSILRETKNIKHREREYFKKHGTYIQKAKAYLQKFYNQ